MGFGYPGATEACVNCSSSGLKWGLQLSDLLAKVTASAEAGQPRGVVGSPRGGRTPPKRVLRVT